MLRLWISVVGLAMLATAAESDRYIVELSGDSVAAHIAKESKRTGQHLGLDSDAAKERREQILKEQQQVGAELKDLGVEILGSTQEASNSLLARMSADLMGKVKSAPGVKAVRRMRTFQPTKTNTSPAQN